MEINNYTLISFIEISLIRKDFSLKGQTRYYVFYFFLFVSIRGRKKSINVFFGNKMKQFKEKKATPIVKRKVKNERTLVN